MNNYRRIYERLRQTNTNASDEQLRRQAWVINDRQIFEVNSTLAPSSSSSAGSGGGSTLSRRSQGLICEPSGGVTISLITNPDITGIDGIAKIHLEYDGLYNDKESFVYHLFPDDFTYDWTLRFNTENGLWELSFVQQFGVVAQSSVSAYSGWEIKIEAFFGISIECGNKNIRNICGTFVNETTTRVNSLEIFPNEGGLIYILAGGILAFIGGVWYLLLDPSSIELGGDAENFPYGTYEIDGTTVTLDEGSCPIL
jgi:hypothetical protein